MAEQKDFDLASKLKSEEKTQRELALKCISPDDAKYMKQSQKLSKYLSADAEWRCCAFVQRVLLETRMQFGAAKQENLDEVDAALKKISPLNISMLEDEVTRHDQLAVIEEIGRFVSEETKALLHPGTTSYDILDTARSYLFREAWQKVIMPEAAEAIEKLCRLAEKYVNSDRQSMQESGVMHFLQTGRTHLQNTSPVPFGATLAIYAARMAERLYKCDNHFDNLKGKVSGIVGTGASIEMVIGKGKAEQFEKAVLEKLGLKPDYTATQIVQKEALADVGHGLTTLMLVLADFANDMRILYSSAIKEVTSRDNKERLGGSSADAMKNNPINYENICGKAKVVESGMAVLYSMVPSDLQRDLRNSVMGRYQPQAMMVETYEAFFRLGKALEQLSVNEDIMARNLEAVRASPSEAMVSILRGEGWIHSKYGAGHDFVKEMGKKAQKEGRPLLEVCLEDDEFFEISKRLPQHKHNILNGHLEEYVGNSLKKAEYNTAYARRVISGKWHMR